jgi:hypothetical protein
MKRPLVAVLAFAASLLASAGLPSGASAGTQCLVINEVYTAGGEPGATYNQDFVELLNRCPFAVSLVGFRVNFQAANTGSSSSGVVFGPGSPSLEPGQFFLIAWGPVGASGAPLPTPDATAFTALDPTAGKVTLRSELGVTCPSPDIVDLVGYGIASVPCFEGAGPAPAPTATQSISRTACIDTDNNALDFTLQAPTPQNTSSPPPACLFTAVIFRSFTASRSSSGVLLRWRTASEPGLLGFNVYRQVGRSGVRLNRRLIASAGSATAGHGYSYRDRRRASKQARYWLQVVHLDGTRTWQGPVAASS